MNVKISRSKLFCAGFATVALLCVPWGTVFAFDRDVPISHFKTLAPSWDGVETTVWINDNDEHPGVAVGDSIIFTMSANQPAHYILISIDSKGSTSVVKPSELEQNYKATTNYIFPPLPDGCSFPISDECKRDTNLVIQREPLGKETVFVIASDQEVAKEVLGIQDKTDFRILGTDNLAIEDLVKSIKRYFSANNILFTVGHYQYYVDTDLQISSTNFNELLDSKSSPLTAGNTSGSQHKFLEYDPISKDIIDRNKGTVMSQNTYKVSVESASPSAQPAIRLEANVLAHSFPHTEFIADQNISALKIVGTPIVANDITFDYGSAVLDGKGKRQLDIIGSELLDRIKIDDFPIIALIGHTDSDGSEDQNMKLSQQRAVEAKYYLVQAWGLPDNHILTSGKGDFIPLVENTSPQNRALNRRVEILLLR